MIFRACGSVSTMSMQRGRPDGDPPSDSRREVLERHFAANHQLSLDFRQHSIELLSQLSQHFSNQSTDLYGRIVDSNTSAVTAFLSGQGAAAGQVVGGAEQSGPALVGWTGGGTSAAPPSQLSCTSMVVHQGPSLSAPAMSTPSQPVSLWTVRVHVGDNVD